MTDRRTQDQFSGAKPNVPAAATGRGGLLVIFSAVIILFLASFWAASIIIKVQKINQGGPIAQGDASRLENVDLDLPKTNTNLVTPDDPSAGSPAAKVHIVEFSDFQCQFCKRSYPIIEQIIKEYGQQIHFIYRDLPLPSHIYARKAAEAAECAQEQGAFWPMHNLIFDNQEELKVSDLKKYAQRLNLDMAKFNNCLDSGNYTAEVEADYKDGLAAGVRGTPTFFINGQMIFGSVSQAEMTSVIDRELYKIN